MSKKEDAFFSALRPFVVIFQCRYQNVTVQIFSKAILDTCSQPQPRIWPDDSATRDTAEAVLTQIWNTI